MNEKELIREALIKVVNDNDEIIKILKEELCRLLRKKSLTDQ